VLHEALGKIYLDQSGVSIRLLIQINKDGVIEEVGMSKRTKNEYVNRTIVYTMKEHIRFLPASKDGQKVKASFEYDFTF
jgi:TonB family protein